MPGLSAPRFVSRQDESRRLIAAAARPPALILVEGEAGIGKTRLVHEAITASPLRTGTLIATCPPYREPFTLGPVIDALREKRIALPAAGLSALAGALRPLFPEWAADLPSALAPLDDAAAARHRVLRALSELLHAVGVWVLAVDDAHWADDTTLEFLLLLASQRAQPMAVVVTYRPEDVPDDSLLLRLSSHPPSAQALLRIVLRALPQSGTGELVSSMLGGQRISQEFAEFVHSRTDGIPLMVEESVRLLHDRADLIHRDGRWERHDLPELHVPTSVRDSVVERSRRLHRGGQLALQATAVLGEPARPQVVAAVASIPPAQAAEGIVEAIRGGLLAEDADGRILFRHSLVARAVYEDIPQVTRSELHLRAGRALEAAGHRSPTQLARHFRLGRDSDRWRMYAEQVAKVAAAAGDDTTAIVALLDVVPEATPVRVRARLTMKLVTMTLGRRVVELALTRTVARTAQDTLEAPGLSKRSRGEIGSLLGRLFMQLGEFGTARAQLERAIPDLAHDPAETARAMIYLGWPCLDPCPADEHLGWLRRAAGLPTGAAPAAERLAHRFDRGTALLLLGEASGWTLADDAPSQAPSLAERRELIRGHLNLGTAALLWGRYARAGEHLDVARGLADAEHDQLMLSCIAATEAHLDWLTGAWSGLAGRVQALAGTGNAQQTQLCARLVAGSLAAVAGDQDHAREMLSSVLDATRRQGVLELFMEPSAGLARLCLADGQAEQALEITREPAEIAARKGVWVQAAELAPARLEALLLAGRAGAARELADAFAVGVGRRELPAAQAAVLLCQAMLAEHGGENERAAALFEATAVAWQRLPRPYDAWLAREGQARCLLAAGGTGRAAALLTEVRTAFGELGAPRDADRAAGLAGADDGGAERPPGTGRRGYGSELSPRELEVVRLAARGWTSRRIAATLSRSPRTVEGQIYSAMRKLGVSSRSALAVAAVRSGVVPDSAED